MSGLDIAKALTEVDDSKFARVTYGVAQADSGVDFDSNNNEIAGDENYVWVLLDGHGDMNKLRCDCFVAKGYRVKVVGDPSGRYLLYSMAGQVEDLQKQIDAIEDVKVRQAPKTGENNNGAFPLLLKNTTSTSNTIVDQVGYSTNVFANPYEGAIRASNYWADNESGDESQTADYAKFHGNAETATRWKKSAQLSLTGVVTGASTHFDGSAENLDDNDPSSTGRDVKLSTSFAKDAKCPLAGTADDAVNANYANEAGSLKPGITLNVYGTVQGTSDLMTGGNTPGLYLWLTDNSIGDGLEYSSGGYGTVSLATPSLELNDNGHAFLSFG